MFHSKTYGTRPANADETASPADGARNGGQNGAVADSNGLNEFERESANHEGTPVPSFVSARYRGNGLNASGGDGAQASLTTHKLATGPNRPGSDYYGFGMTSAKNLSAGAVAFHPGNDDKPSPMKFLNCNSSPDDQPIIVNSSTANNKKGKEKRRDDVQDPVGAKSRKDTPPATRGTFTTDVGPKIIFQGGHYLKLVGIKKVELNSTLRFIFDDFNWGNKIIDSACHLVESDIFTYFLCFNRIKDAEAALFQVELGGATWGVTYITQSEYASQLEASVREQSSYYDGQVLLVATYKGQSKDFGVDGVHDKALEVAETFGKVHAFVEIDTAAAPNLEFRVEYDSITDARECLKVLLDDDPHIWGNWHIFSKPLAEHFAPTGDNGHVHGVTASMAGMNVGGTPHKNGPLPNGLFPSPTGRTAWREDGNGNVTAVRPPNVVPKIKTMPYGPTTMATPARADRYQSDPNPQTPASGGMMHEIYATDRRISWDGVQRNSIYDPATRSPVPTPQAVLREKIECGMDVRTTIMLRNIPNRMTFQELKALLDVTSFGAYDFSYLRIDFEKGTNVGYAFVNFADPMDIIPFLDYYENKCWMAGNKRMVEMSYATVQGFDCLVEKFRNSAIMSEFRDYRPKLWFTPATAENETDVGMEMTFPSPNNPSKSQRSRDNAGTIGLYAPHANHSGRERGRRSQYDRGTTAQLQEDAFHNGSPYNGSAMMRARMLVGGQAPGFPVMPYNYHAPSYPMVPYSHQLPAFLGPYYNNNGMMLQPQHFGHMQFGGVDPFANTNLQGAYGNTTFGNGAYANGGNGNGGVTFNNGNGDAAFINGNGGAPFNNANASAPFVNGNGNGGGFGMGPNTPASRLRTHTNGRLGGRPKNVTTVGGPVQTPGGNYDEQGSGADGRDGTPSPHYPQNS